MGSDAPAFETVVVAASADFSWTFIVSAAYRQFAGQA